MAVQYHYNIGCKRISDDGWMTTMNAEQGEIPMSIVQPRTEVDAHFQPVETTGTLTTEPMVQEISDTGLVTAYLRGLNRRPGWELAWHNDAVIWNLSLRLGKMEIGQQVNVRVSYFSTKGIGSGVYEIKLLDVSHEDTPTKGSTQESNPVPQTPAVSPSPKVASNTDDHVFSRPAPETHQEDVPDTVSQLTARVENLQDQLMMVRKTLHQVLERIERLETRAQPPTGTGTVKGKTPHRPPEDIPESTEKHPVTMSEDPARQTADIEDDSDEPNLFEYLAESQKKSTAVKNVPSNDAKDPQKKQ